MKIEKEREKESRKKTVTKQREKVGVEDKEKVR